MLLLLALSRPALATTTIYVPEQYTSLQDAVLASALNGVIYVDVDGRNERTGEGWDPGSQAVVSISTSLDIRAAEGAPRAVLPPLKVNGGAVVGLEGVELLGGYRAYVRVNDGGEQTLQSLMLYVADGATVNATDLLMDGGREGVEGGAVVLDGALSITDVTATGFQTARPFYLLSEGGYGSLTATGVSLHDNAAGAIFADGHVGEGGPGLLSLTIYDGEITNSQASVGGAIAAVDVEFLILYDLLLANNAATAEGGAIYGEDVRYGSLSGLILTGEDIDGGGQIAQSGAGAGVRVLETDITDAYWTLTDVHFAHMSAVGRGGAVLSGGADLLMSGITAEQLEASAGAFVFAEGGSLGVEQADVREFVAGAEGGAISLRGVSRPPDDRPTLRWTKLCHGDGGQAGAALALDAQLSDVLIDFTTLQFNAREAVPLVSTDGGALGLVNVTFADNDAAALVQAVGAQVLLTNSILSGGQVGLLVSDAASEVRADHNLWWDLSGELARSPEGLGIPTSEDIVAAADFWSGYIDSDCDTDPLLRWGSPARDAAMNPVSWLGADSAEVWRLVDSSYRNDPDGTPADLGAYAGLLAEYPFNTDEDGDGWILGYDCDDDPNSAESAGRNPGATEVWYDGVDADCDGQNDYDADGDGYTSAEHGGDDCADTKPTIHPGAEETPGDGIDSDCDGEDGAAGGDDTGEPLTSRYGLSGGCSAGRGPTGLAWLALLLLARRRP